MLIKRLIIFIQIFFILPLSATAIDNHWAESELQTIYQIDGIYIDEPDSMASIELQESIFKFAGLKIVPEEGLKRYWLIKNMVDNLGLPEATEEEITTVLGDYTDRCDYCNKANLVLTRARKCGLLGGRTSKAGLVTAPKEPVTSAELVVFALRYMRIKNYNLYH